MSSLSNELLPQSVAGLGADPAVQGARRAAGAAGSPHYLSLPVIKHIDKTGGPPWRHARDDEKHAVYDAVCWRFYQFLTGTKS